MNNLDSSAKEVMEESRSLRSWTIGEVVYAIGERWLLVVACIGAMLFLSVMLIRVVTPTYSVSMVIAPKTRGLTQTAETNLTSRLLGSVSSSQTSPFELFAEMLTSQLVAEQLCERYDMHKRIWSSNWHKQDQTWVPPRGILPFVASTLRKVAGRSAWQPPNAAQLAEFLKTGIKQESTKVNLFGASSVQRVTITISDPELAVDILRAVHLEADSILRNARIEELDASIEFLNAELKTNNIASTQEALSEVLSALLKERVLVAGDTYYAAELVDPPSVPRQPSFPRIKLFLATGFFLGGMLGVILAIFFERKKTHKATI